VTGKVTVGLALHWPCVTGLTAKIREMRPHLRPFGHGPLYLLLISDATGFCPRPGICSYMVNPALAKFLDRIPDLDRFPDIRVELLMTLDLRPMGCHLPYVITQCYLPLNTSEHAQLLLLLLL